MLKDFSLTIYNLVKKVNENTTGIFERTPELITVLPQHIAVLIGDSDIYFSEFVIAKIKGKISGFRGHPKINDDILYKIPESLSSPYKILKDTRRSSRKEYLFINLNPLHQVVIEIERRDSGLTEINTIFESTESELKRLEGKLPTIFSSGEAPDLAFVPPNI